MRDEIGFEIHLDVVAAELMASLRRESERFTDQPAAGQRGVLRESSVFRELALAAAFRALAETALPAPAFPVRAILFDKTPGANWKVPWHQDLAIAVAERHEVEGFGPWSVKDGVPHVHAPVWLLERMVTFRLHLDDCPAENGALRVLPSSHRHGKLSAEQIADWRSRVPETVCEVPAGGVLLMRPLLLHASSAATRPGHRRVLHVEYACDRLPDGLEWAEAVA
jgi:ectoine hydroxylase-related dioxygenase (phytanoyl-CoA dioxygenase family)